MTYANFEFYTDEYKGNLIDEDDFDRLEMRAAAYIDLLTNNRTLVVVDEETLNLIRMASCAAAEVLWKQEQGGEIKSESVGSHSVTYATPEVPYEIQLLRAVKLYLGQTSLLYQGFYSDEVGCDEV